MKLRLAVVLAFLASTSGPVGAAAAQGATDSDYVLFHASLPCRTSGTHGLTVRVLPHHPDLGHPHETGLIAWAT